MRTPHQNLTESFPELKEAFKYLKMNDSRFQHILKEYEVLDNRINHIDNGGDNVEPLFLEELKKQRVALKDQLYHCMTKYKSEHA